MNRYFLQVWFRNCHSPRVRWGEPGARPEGRRQDGEASRPQHPGREFIDLSIDISVYI